MPRAPGKREEQAAIRREQVLSAALALFCERGYAGTSTRRIAEAAGVAESLVFHYFPTKDALLIALASRRHTFAGRVLAAIEGAGEGTARALLVTIAGGFSQVSAEERGFIGFMLAETQVNASLRAQVAAANEAVHAAFVAALQRRVAAGELRADASLSAAVFGFSGGFLFFFTQHRELDDAAWRRAAARFARAWADQCWRGIAAPQALSEHSTNRPDGRRSAT